MKPGYRTLGILLALALAATIAVDVGTRAIERASVRDHARSRLAAEADFLSTFVLADLDPHDFAHDAARRLGLRVTLIGDDGRVLGDSSRDPASLERMDDHSNRPEIAGARLGVVGWSIRTSDTTGVDYLYHAHRTAGGGPVRFVRLAAPLSQLRDGNTPRVRWRNSVLAALAFLALALVGYVRLRGVSKPLEQLAEEIEDAADSDRGFAPATEPSRELARIERAVGRLQANTLARVSASDSERAVLTSVIMGMKEGLLLVAGDGRVTLANPALLRILELDATPEGRPLTEVIRNPPLLEDIERTIRGEQTVVESVLRPPGSGRAFEIRVTPIPPSRDGGAGGALVLWFDITQLESLERVRRDFVANVSHELRTPLTAIQAANEALLGQETNHDEMLQFLHIVRRNAEHMGALVEELTDLSLIETGAVTCDLREVDVHEVCHDIVQRLDMVAGENGVELRVEVPRPFHMRADRRRLEQLLVNLIDNGLKFNREGGHVTVSAHRTPENAVIVVEDSGIGIPSQSLDKIFHRFYQVNSERTGRTRGTGLGLALVKHLVRLHGGSVRVESELGDGSRFTLLFPRHPDFERDER